MGRTQGKRCQSAIMDGLFSATRQKVLGLLFSHPERSFFASEIIDRIGAGSGAVQRELSRLVDAGILDAFRRGNQKHYQVSPTCPIREELRSIIRKTIGFVRPLLDALDPIAESIDLALVYGSMATGQESSASDVDLLIVSDHLALEELFHRLEAAEELIGRRIHPTLLSSAEFRERRNNGNPFIKRLLTGEHLVLLGTLGADVR